MAIKKNFGKLALAIHKKLQGKIEVTPKASVTNRDDLSTYYTPGVGTVSSYLATHPEEMRNYTMKGNTVAVVSDGSAVLGLGNIGPEGAMPVMEGKAMLFKALAGVNAIPLVLATQDTEEIIATVKNIAPAFGGINLEDIAAPRCFEIEARLRKELSIPVMHDDQHGTALVVLAGLINATKVVKKNLRQTRIVIAGAGAAGHAIAELLRHYGVRKMIFLDSQGTLHSKRRNLEPSKKALLQMSTLKNVAGDLSVALRGADIFVGVSKANTLKPEQVKLMNSKSIIFGLANPVPEIMPDVAKKAGAYVVATGRSDFPNQINNSLGFPGIFRGALDHGVRNITDEMLIQAAKNLAALIRKPTPENIVPHTFDKRVVKAVAKAIR